MPSEPLQRHYKFNVQGRLLAVGTEQDPIIFTAEDKTAGWHGVRFNQTPSTNDTSKLIYCSFRYGKANTGSGWDRCGGAIFIRGFDKVFISNSLFESNMNSGEISSTAGAVIYVEAASPIVTNNVFLKNTGTTDCAILFLQSNGIISNNVFSNNSGCHGPVFCYYNAPTVTDNIISNNITTRAGGGIFTVTSTAIVTNNIIFNNSCFGVEGEGGGIKSWMGDKSIIINNTIVNNSAAHGGGFCCNDNADPILINNIIWGNISTDGNQVNFVDINSDPHFSFNDIEGGKEAFAGTGAGANYTGLYENNIDADPVFVDAASDDFSLSNSSSCIGKGINSVEIGGVLYNVPPFCNMGNPRPSPAGSNPDIGACENLNPTVGIEQELITPRDFVLYQNYPNPFNPATAISWQSPVGSWQILKVYDVLGNEVATLVNEYKPAGSYKVKFDGGNLASGIYFYKIQAGDYTAVKKMVLLK
jgi:hypothetical protein